LPAISGDATTIAFVSTADTQQAIYIYEQNRGYAYKAAIIDNISRPKISDNGNYIAFSTQLPLSADDKNRRSDIYLAQPGQSTALTPSIQLKWLTSGANDDSYISHISSDGHKIGFYSYASNLLEDDGNEMPDIFIYK